MCWSASVSLFFAVFESLALVFICWTCFTFKKNYFKRNPTKKFINFSHNLQYERLLWSLPFAISINVVEWSEFFIWLGSPEVESTLEGPRAACENCSYLNYIFTTLAGIAVCSQPFSTMLFAYKTHSKSLFFDEETQKKTFHEFAENTKADYEQEELELKYKYLFGTSRDRFLIPYFFSWVSAILITLVWIWYLLFSSNNDECFYNKRLFASMVSSCTCSYVGENGHLIWTFYFPCQVSEFLPNVYNYILLANFAPFFYAPCWFSVPMMGSLYLFIIELFWFAGSTEVYSVWCWTGVGAHFVYVLLALTLYADHTFEMFEKCGMNGTVFELGKLSFTGTMQAFRKSKPFMDCVGSVKRKVRSFLFLR